MVGCEEDDGRRYLFGSSHSIEWNGRHQACLSFGSASEAIQHTGLDWTGGVTQRPVARIGEVDLADRRNAPGVLVAILTYGTALN